MIVIIAGGRTYHANALATAWLNAMHERLHITEVVSGGASGADKLGEEWAMDNKLATTIFSADWATHGRAAGPIRNERMAVYLQGHEHKAVLLFPGGSGTRSMRGIARQSGLTIYDFLSKPPLLTSASTHL